MRRFNPSPRVDQLREYWTSDHGQQLKQHEDPAVATCVSCHGKPHGNALDKAKHGVLGVKEPESPVFPTNVAETCAHCHSDAKLMAGRKYHGQPIGHDQYDQWRQSVHAEALLKKGDLSAATCNNCHGNHGAVPPQADSVANACGICHAKNAELFNQTIMKHGFEKVGLPGCATCHGDHLIRSPTVEMLGMQQGAVCARCHAEGKFGATLAGAKVAQTLRSDLEGLRDQIRQAHATIEEAEQLGMEVSGPRFDLHKATDALQNARVQMHSFAVEPVENTLKGGRKTATEVQDAAEAALHLYHYRRIWLAASLVPILVVIVLLILYIRTDSESTEAISPRVKEREYGK
jgi:predicted CXXCH cytochrome family protein